MMLCSITGYNRNVAFPNSLALFECDQRRPIGFKAEEIHRVLSPRVSESRSSSFSSAVNRRFWEELLTQRKSNPLLSRHSAASVQSTDNGGSRHLLRICSEADAFLFRFSADKHT